MSKNKNNRANSPRTQPPRGGAILAAQHIEVSSHILPPPKELEEYKRIYPEAVERIFAMAEREQEERHRAQAYALETLRLDNEGERSAEKRGQWMATIFLWGTLVAAFVLAILGLTIPACLLGAAPLANVLNTIITRAKK